MTVAELEKVLEGLTIGFINASPTDAIQIQANTINFKIFRQMALIYQKDAIKIRVNAISHQSVQI